MRSKALRPESLAAQVQGFGKALCALTMTLGTLLLIVLLFAAVGALPQWPHSAGWGYWPSGLIVLSLVAVTVLILAERPL